MQEASWLKNFRMDVMSKNQRMKTNFPAKALVTLVTSRLWVGSCIGDRRCFWPLAVQDSKTKWRDRRIPVQDQISYPRTYVLTSQRPDTGSTSTWNVFHGRSGQCSSVNTFYYQHSRQHFVTFSRSLQSLTGLDKKPLQDSRLPSVLFHHSE